jgi:integrase
VLSLTCGARTEEVRALRWESVDLEAGTVAVWRSVCHGGDTKTGKSRRTLALPQTAIQTLKEHKKRQAEDRLAAGPLWQEDGYVFATTVGTEMDRHNVLRQFRKITKKAGLGDTWAFLRVDAVRLWRGRRRDSPASWP